MRRAVKIILALLLVTALSGCARVSQKQDSWSTIKQRKTVVIGMDDSFVPMGFRQKNGKLAGYDIDLARAVFKRYGIKVDFQTIDWSMKETELKNQTIDLIWNGYTVNHERAKKVAFSDTYLQNHQVLVSDKKAHIDSVNDMKGKTLGVQTSSSGLTSLDAQPQLLKDKIAKKTPVLYDNFNEAFLDLQAGRIQGLLIDSVYAKYYLAHLKNGDRYRVTATPFQPEDFAVGMRKSDKTLQKKINQAFAALYRDGTMRRISEKWFGEDDTVKP
ncbi:glutamine ABC transporter, substrate binding protein [Lactobacillus selangorensis]|uniref:Glutamine ABC transporter, substrate binding protein n=1 Tax=Lactobacillus selangorensis TaxID=81857 RepID=A0A0R2FL55_9LACO|nr:amino acid ABC transporter substrate-binding protein [Lactobacillus selangorensis]KRN29353.1 glutamine ABC transporter, substrate binding protein [Lactobacillus selangorensis]KRN34118.1 glutamine ABC transporter, substrate binding protein [Lactobacillus selangorensis]